MKLKFLLFFALFITGAQALFAAPVITAFNPSSGPVGTLVTVTGTGLSSPTAFTIGGKNAVVVSNTDTKLVAMVMPGAVTGSVSLTTASGTAVGASDFTVIAGVYPQNQQGSSLSGTGSVGTSFQGSALALSADGNTAIVGGPLDDVNTGAVWIFVRNGGTWSQQGSKLVGTASGTDARQGSSVALSADGNTAVVGGYNYNSGEGAAWVFVRDASGVWSQQGDKLIGTGAVGKAIQGAVSISADGNTIALGGYADDGNKGATWVFVRGGGVWSQQGNKLIGTGGVGAAQQGQTVALSSEGNTLLIGAPGDDHSTGASWIFKRVGGNWIQQGNKFHITQFNEGGAGALTADGSAAFVGYTVFNENDPGFGSPSTYQSGVQLYTQINGIWEAQNNYVSDVRYSLIGGGLSINADGKALAVTGPAPGTTDSTSTSVSILNNWTNKINLIPSGKGAYGVAISADGTTAIVGDNSTGGNTGSVRFFVSNTATDHITFAQPGALTYGAADTALAATSTNTALPVTFASGDTTVATIVNNKLHIKAAGTVNITASQANPDILPVTHSVIINKAPLIIKADDKSVVVTGPIPALTATYTGFVNSETVASLDTAATLSTVATPSSPVGTYAIIASGAASKNYAFTYQNGSLVITADTSAAPVITAITPTSGVVGSLVTISGTRLGNPTGFSIGGVPAVIISNNGTQLIGLVMPGASTGVVSVTTTGGTSSSVGVFKTLELKASYTQQGSKVMGTGGIGNDPRQGYSVALSADGNTAVVGAPFDNSSTGAVYIFVRDNGMWQQQGNKLVGTESVGTQQQGVSVAISADGNTIAVGGNGNSTGIGGAWVFTRSNAVWTQQGPKIPRPNGAAAKQFGSTIALSADGNTMAVAAIAGSATYIYTRTANTWTMQATINKIGYDVALSADGNTLLGSDVSANSGTGAGWVFTRNGNVWTQQGVTLVGTGGIGQSFQGYSVGLSADGNTAVMGAPSDNANAGAFWVFTRNSGGVWSQQGSKMSGSGAVGSNIVQGRSVAISADGNTIVESGYIDNNNAGATWIFRRTNGVWAQLGQKLVGTDGGGIARQGAGVGISADGTTVIAGGEAINSSWFFVAPLPDYGITFAQPDALTYGVADTAFAITSTNTSVPIVLSSDNTDVASVIGNKIHVKAVGTVNITASQNDVNILPVTRKLTINQAQVTITADDKTKQPGADNPAFAATYAGFKNGEDTTVLAAKPVFTTTATKNSPQGTYPITVGGASAKNYSFVYVNGTLTVASNALPNNVNVKLTMSPLAVLTLASSSSGQYDYTASVAAGTDSVSITPVPANPGATVTVEGVTVASGAASAPIALHSGVTVIHVVVHAADGTTVRNYNISVTKNGSSDASLKSLSLINPRAIVVSVSSDGTTLNKSASVQASTNAVSVYAVANDPTATIRVNGAVLTGTTSDPVTLNAGSVSTQINMSVTAEDGTSRLYVITVNKTGSSDASLKTLRITDPVSVLVNGTSTGNVFYKSTSVSATTSVITLNAEATEAHATIKVNGTVLTGSSIPVTLNSDSNPTNINVMVTAQDGTTATYIVVVNKNGSSDAGLQSWGVFGPAAIPVTSVSSSGTTFYKAATVANSVSFVLIRALPADPNATIRVNGNLLLNGQSEPLSLHTDNTPTTIQMVVTAQDGSTRTYVIVVSKAPALAGRGINQQQSFASAPVNTEVVVHQGLSPNGDGLNDVLVIEGLEDKTDNHISIVNVNGALVYETQAYGSNGNVFDGHSNKTGVLQKPGTYYYVLEYNDGKGVQRKTGYIVLKY